MGVLAQVTFSRTEPQGRGPTDDARARFREALDVARTYAEEPSGWLALLGGSGTGKTHLAAAIANRCMERGEPVFFAFVPDLLDHLRASFNPEHELSYDEFFEQVKSIPILVLDDLGMQSSTPWAQEKLFQVLNHRYVTGLPTVITTNVPADQHEARLQSRLLDSRTTRVVDLGGDAQGALPGIGAIEPELLRQMTFERFETAGAGLDAKDRESIQAAQAVAKAFALDPDGWLVLLGESGRGKTHLAVAVANERLQRSEPVFFAFVPDLLDHLRYTFNPDSRVTYDELFEMVKGTPFLILDDLGSESSTAWAHEKLYQIIVHRHNARLPTIITTRGLSAREGDPIASRLDDVRVVAVVTIAGPDYRQGGRRRTPPPRRKP